MIKALPMGAQRKVFAVMDALAGEQEPTEVWYACPDCDGEGEPGCAGCDGLGVIEGSLEPEDLEWAASQGWRRVEP